MATQNPIEMEGTYPLPEAQLDRFLMKILVAYPSREDLNRIVDVTTKNDEVTLQTIMGRAQIAQLKSVCRQVLVAPHVQEYAIAVIMATQPGVRGAADITNRYVRYGSSPRGAQALIECGRVLALMRGRLHLSIEDVATVAPGVLRHRIILNFDAHADGETTETILAKILAGVAPSWNVSNGSPCTGRNHLTGWWVGTMFRALPDQVRSFSTIAIFIKATICARSTGAPSCALRSSFSKCFKWNPECRCGC
jgi:MoxR-like ATPase